MKQICTTKFGKDGKVFNDIQCIHALLHDGQKHIQFEELGDYCRYKKNIDFLKKEFRKVGYVPSFFVHNNFFYWVKVHHFTLRGHEYEEISILPICSACNKFKKYEIKAI